MIWTPINKSLVSKGFQQNNNFLFARDASLVEISLFELKNCVATMPIGFFFKENTLGLVGLLGLDAKRNLFVDSTGKWLTRYIPATFSTYPFKIIDIKVGDETKKTIGILESEATIVEEDEGVPFFDKKGQMSQPLLKIANFLQQKYISELHTHKACSLIKELDLLIPWDLQYIRNVDGGSQKQVIKGLFRINEEKFKSISEKELSRLNETQALAIIFANFYSAQNLFQLNELFLGRESSEQELKELGDSIFEENPLSDLDLYFD